MSCLASISHNCTIPAVRQAPLPVASILPSGLNATLLTAIPSPLRVAVSCLVATSHNCTIMTSVPQFPCPLALASILPSGLNATLLIGNPSPLRVAVSCLVATSHNCTMPSVPQIPYPLALASVLPSGLNATLLTLFGAPVRVSLSCPVSTSHNRIPVCQFPRLLLCRSTPLASVLPSGLNATLKIESVCPKRVFLSCPVAASHSRTLLYRESPSVLS